jgi:ParB family transcriptional regulator, chromosome partitioning protein
MAEEGTSAAYEKGQLYQINLNNLLADPRQPRKSMDAQALDELAASIAKVGVIQPIVFRLDGQGNMLVVAGERRVAAARKAGLTAIPAIFIDGNYAEIAMVENLLRQDLTPIEEAEALQALMTEQNYTQDQLSAVIGKARTTLCETLSLNKLPKGVRDDCRADRTISRATLIAIARKKQARAMTTAYNAYRAKQGKGKTTRQKTDPNAPQTLFDIIDKTVMKLRGIDRSAWTEEDNMSFQIALNSLRETIDIAVALPSTNPV